MHNAQDIKIEVSETFHHGPKQGSLAGSLEGAKNKIFL